MVGSRPLFSRAICLCAASLRALSPHLSVWRFSWPIRLSATTLLWLATTAFVYAANSCIEYRSLIGSQLLFGPWAATAQEAAAAGVAQCNSWWHNAVGCYGGNIGECAEYWIYTCTGEVPASVQTPTEQNDSWQQMTVQWLGPDTGSGVVSLWLQASNPVDNCVEYFVQASTVARPMADQGRYCPACKNGPDPVNPSLGNEFLTETDIEPVGSRDRLAFKRYYNSLNASESDLGAGWRHTFNRSLKI